MLQLSAFIKAEGEQVILFGLRELVHKGKLPVPYPQAECQNNEQG
jgi:hypothetical protein